MGCALSHVHGGQRKLFNLAIEVTLVPGTVFKLLL